MKLHTLAAVALSNRDYPDFRAKLAEAAKWVEFAAAQGAELVVLPEGLNLYQGDGVASAKKLSLADVALDDWQFACAPLLDAAKRANTAVTVPLYVRRGNAIANAFFVVSRTGDVLGEYRKRVPTPSECAAGVVAGDEAQPLIPWHGLKLGGLICFDCYYPRVIESQARRGADLFLAPSLTPAGDYLNFYALHHAAPIALAYPAWSRIVDITGKDVAGAGYRNETLNFGFGTPVALATINFDRVSLYADVNQLRIVDVQRRYGPRVRVTFDQPNVTFFLESLSPDVTCDAIVREFGLVPRREYFAASNERAPNEPRP